MLIGKMCSPFLPKAFQITQSNLFYIQVDIEVNEVPVNIHMKLDDNGAAYFVEVVDSDEEEEDIPPSKSARFVEQKIFVKPSETLSAC